MVFHIISCVVLYVFHGIVCMVWYCVAWSEPLSKVESTTAACPCQLCVNGEGAWVERASTHRHHLQWVKHFFSFLSNQVANFPIWQFDTNLASINIGAGQLDAGRCRKSPAPTLTASQARQLKETLKGEIFLLDHHDQLPPLPSGCCERCPRRVDWSRQQRRNESSQFHQQRLGEEFCWWSMINIMSIMVHVKDARTSNNSTQQRLCDNKYQGKHLAKRLFDLSNKKVSPTSRKVHIPKCQQALSLWLRKMESRHFLFLA